MVKDLFGEEPKKKIHGVNDLHLGYCDLCGYDGEVKQCSYCTISFCDDCGSFRKNRCERCLAFFADKSPGGRA